METIGTDNPFTAAQEATIVAFAAALIPASEEYGVPSAGDPAIADARPPFPKGFDVEQGDWSLLDPVKRRGTIYRPVAG